MYEALHPLHLGWRSKCDSESSIITIVTIYSNIYVQAQQIFFVFYFMSYHKYKKVMKNRIKPCIPLGPMAQNRATGSYEVSGHWLKCGMRSRVRVKSIIPRVALFWFNSPAESFWRVTTPLFVTMNESDSSSHVQALILTGHWIYQLCIF